LDDHGMVFFLSKRWAIEGSHAATLKLYIKKKFKLVQYVMVYVMVWVCNTK